MGRTLRKRRQKKKLNFIKLNENIEESLISLKSWLLNENCLSIRHLIPEYFPLTGRGLKTLKHIESNEVLIQLPFRMLITTDTLLQSNIRFLFLNTTDSFSPQCMLATFLIYETHLGIKSKWYLYLKTLPQSFTNPDFCSNKEKRILPSFILDSLHQAHKLESNFSLLMKAMKHLDIINKNHCSHCSLHLRKVITFEKYKWAYYVVNTRAVYIDTKLLREKNTFNIKQPNNLALAPFLDLFNHNVNTAVKVSIITDNNQNQFYQIITLKPFDKESQVFINYGAHNNLKLYIDYGFFIPCNPLDEIHFDILEIQRCFDIPKSKLDFITFNSFHKNMSFTRDGLNYNATVTLFILGTKLEKNCWKMKIYSKSFDPYEFCFINKLGISILNMKKMEYTHVLNNMRNLKSKSQSFSIAIDLVDEYINILHAAFNYIKETVHPGNHNLHQS